MNFFFRNIIWIILILFIVYVIRQYKKLKAETQKIISTFNNTLNPYLVKKITEAQNLANMIKEKYKDDDAIKAELDRLVIPIEKGVNGTINDKVTCSNAINKYKPNKNMDLEKYPELIQLDNLGTFTEAEMNSIDGLALARRDYNAMAFRYNEVSTSFPIQYLTKILKLTSFFIIFDATKTQYQTNNSELYEELTTTIATDNPIENSYYMNEEAQLDSLSRMNRKDPIPQEESPVEEQKTNQEENENHSIEEADNSSL